MEAAQTDQRAPGERGAAPDRDTGAVARLVAHLHCMQGARGSSLLSST